MSRTQIQPRRSGTARAAAILTAIGLVGVLVDGFGLIPAAGPVGCGFGILILVLLFGVLVFLFAWFVVAALASWGIFLLFRRSASAPYLLIPVNLATMSFFGYWTPVYPGQLIWGAIVVLFALCAAAACALMIHRVLAEGPLPRRILATAIIAIVVSFPTSLYVSGVFSDIALAITPSAAAVTATSDRPC